jgi:hypothetical protein
MKGFWQLVSLIISSIGFLIVLGTLLIQGECLFVSALRGMLVFVGLLIVLRLFGDVLYFTSEQKKISEPTDGEGQQ